MSAASCLASSCAVVAIGTVALYLGLIFGSDPYRDVSGSLVDRSSAEADNGSSLNRNDASSPEPGSGGNDAAVGNTETVYPRLAAIPRDELAKVWNAEELALYKGVDPARPLLLCIIGEVYEVGPGAKHYAPGGGYQYFSGRDFSRGFAVGGDDESSQLDSLDGLTAEEFEGATGWRDFYRNHDEYRFVGYLDGRYFDSNAHPTAAHVEVEKRRDAAGQVAKLKEAFDKRFMTCNSRNAQADPDITIWCDNSYHGKGAKPMHIYFTLPSAPGAEVKEEGRCTCIRKKAREQALKDAAKPMPGQISFRLVEYPECGNKQTCKRPKGSKPP